MNENNNVNLVRVGNLPFSGDKKDFIQKRMEIRKTIILIFLLFIKENRIK
tara:strand:+ start:41 stop:190 length:150 start_codon:yes stop_codon:yes gene_type:complete